MLAEFDVETRFRIRAAAGLGREDEELALLNKVRQGLMTIGRPDGRNNRG